MITPLAKIVHPDFIISTITMFLKVAVQSMLAPNHTFNVIGDPGGGGGGGGVGIFGCNLSHFIRYKFGHNIQNNGIEFSNLPIWIVNGIKNIFQGNSLIAHLIPLVLAFE